MYEFLANSVMIFHAVLILTVLIGIAASIKYKRYRPVEALILLGAVVIWSLYKGCPLTFLEDYLRSYTTTPIRLAEIGFIPYYLKAWFGLGLSNRNVELLTYAASSAFMILTIDWELPVLKKLFKKKQLKKLFRF